jgi:hypothetical protein
MLPDEPFDAALADAVALGQLALRGTRSEGGDEVFPVSLAEPVSDPPLTGTQGRGVNTACPSAGLRLRLAELRHRADQEVYEVPAVQVRPYKAHHEVFTFQPSPCSRLVWALPGGCRGLEPA